MRFLAPLLLVLAAGVAFAADPQPPAAAVRAEMAQRWPEALAIYRKELQSNPQRVDLWLRMADIYATLKQPGETARATAEAALLRPDDAALQARLSQAYAINNDPAMALAAMRRAVVLQPQNLEYLRAQAELASWSGDLALAKSSQRAILALAPDDAAATQRLARLQMQAGDLDGAVRMLEMHLRQQPQDADARLLLAEVQTYRGNYAAADAQLRRYHQSQGDTAAWRRQQANLLARSSRTDAALALLQPQLQEQPRDYDLHLMQTLALHGGRQRRNAEAGLESLRRLGPQRPETAGTALQVHTPARPYLAAGAEYYTDSIPLSVLRSELKAALGGAGPVRLSAQAHHWQLRTDAGTGYETPKGELEASARDAWVLAELRPHPDLSITAGGGAAAYTDADSHLLGAVGLNWWACDQLSLALQHQRQPVPVSPKAAALGMRRTESRLAAEWRPGYRTTVQLNLASDRYSDDNRREQYNLAPRWAVLRTQGHNLDLGLSAERLRYDHISSNGYYAPEDFQRYWAMGYYYRKAGDNRGFGLVLGAGPERDRQLDDDFRIGGNVYAEGIFGVYQGWQLRAYGGYGSRLDAGYLTGKPHGHSLGLELLRRF